MNPSTVIYFGLVVLAIGLAMMAIHKIRSSFAAFNAAERELQRKHLAMTLHNAAPLPAGSIIRGSIIDPEKHAAEYGTRPAAPRPYHKATEKPKNFGRRNVPPRVLLSTSQMQHINIQRRSRGQQMLTREGFRRAISHAWDQPVSPPRTSDDWTYYLILYMLISSSPSFQSSTARVEGAPVIVDQSAPYFGQGLFLYAGPEANLVTNALTGKDASGNYVSQSDISLYPDTPAGSSWPNAFPGAQSDLMNAAPDLAQAPSYTPDPTPSPNVDSSTSYTPDPTPSYTPDPAPSYTPDPTPSFDSGSSSSF